MSVEQQIPRFRIRTGLLYSGFNVRHVSQFNDLDVFQAVPLPGAPREPRRPRPAPPSIYGQTYAEIYFQLRPLKYRPPTVTLRKEGRRPATTIFILLNISFYNLAGSSRVVCRDGRSSPRDGSVRNAGEHCRRHGASGVSEVASLVPCLQEHVESSVLDVAAPEHGHRQRRPALGRRGELVDAQYMKFRLLGLQRTSCEVYLRTAQARNTNLARFHYRRAETKTPIVFREGRGAPLPALCSMNVESEGLRLRFALGNSITARRRPRAQVMAVISQAAALQSGRRRSGVATGATGTGACDPPASR
ncbi:hypothetical protein EVAR_48233_1 [Eumeta japonica]|uniref:Uncharacterized protein n=1 Tax=Eumeta variegata TaxID=151549 RepID=A0A4C1YGR5_EUMVA|nr:hypothetical protein EVAR_48233_1 [Eumeta japonica]